MNVIPHSTLSLDRMGQWPLSIKMGVILGMGILIVILGYWYDIKPNFEQYAMLHTRELALKLEFESKQHQASNLHAYRNQLKWINTRFGALLKQLPAKNEMPALLEDISKTGVSSGLQFKLFAPQAEIQHDFYIELPIKMTLVGQYMQYAVFISRIAEMNRMVTLHEFSLETQPSKTHTMGSEDALEMNLTATIYRYRAQ